jgi:hypothetical protein
MTGLGPPPMSFQWIEGPGDGSKFRSKRALSRDVDIPVIVYGPDRAGLKREVQNLAWITGEQCTLVASDTEERDSWRATAYLVSGFDYVYGVDTTGRATLKTVLTFRTPDPYWTRTRPQQQIAQNAGAGRGLLSGSLTKLRLSASQAIGTLTLDNPGDVEAYPLWRITGPGDNFQAVHPVSGRDFIWEGIIPALETLRVDTRTGKVTFESNGSNQYAELGYAPLLWAIPPGTSTASVGMANTTPASRIECTWNPRKQLVI